MTLQDRLNAAKAEMKIQVSAARRAVMDRVTADVISGGQAEGALKAGESAPSFVLPDANGRLASSVELLKRGPLVVTFYRGIWCSYCNLDLQALEASLDEIRSTGASLVAISPQTAPNGRKTQRDNKLKFPILSDKAGSLAARFGLTWSLPSDLRAVYKSLGADLPAFNDDNSWALPIPARYVIGQDGVIVYAEINPDHTCRPDPSELMPTLKRLKQSAAVAAG